MSRRIKSDLRKEIKLQRELARIEEGLDSIESIKSQKKSIKNEVRETAKPKVREFCFEEGELVKLKIWDGGSGSSPWKTVFGLIVETGDYITSNHHSKNSNLSVIVDGIIYSVSASNCRKV